MLTRRQFIQTAAAATASAQTRPKRVAILGGESDILAERFRTGYALDGAWHMPGMQVVDTVPGADAVLIADDRGDQFFDQCVQAFAQDGRGVPAFIAGGLSASFEKAKAMVDTSRRLRFPLLAGSALPVTFRLPPIELPLGCHMEEALMVGLRDFDAFEALQCMVERRGRGETGVRAVQCIEGDAVWKAGYSQELLTAALSRSDTPLGLTVTDGRTQDLVASGQLPKLVEHPAAYFIEYRDGLKATVLLLNGAIQDFNFAARIKGARDIQSTQFLLTPQPNATYHTCLIHKAEQMFATGIAPNPVERTLLVAGMLESCLKSKLQNHARLETPHLSVTYRARS
jgi:hypothetical protein